MDKVISFEMRARTALVTGGSSGIGKALCHGLAQAGIEVAAADINESALDEVVDEVRAEEGQIVGFPTDISDRAQAVDLANKARETLGSIDVLVNAAGIYPRASVLEMDLALWDRVLSVNLHSIFVLAREVLPQMTKNGFGRIVSLTSDLGTSGIPLGAHYAVSKAGLNVLTRSLAREIRVEDVTINAVAPGPTDTPMLRRSNTPEYIESVAAQTARGSLGTPDDVVGTVLFLISQAGSRTTGQVLPLNN